MTRLISSLLAAAVLLPTASAAAPQPGQPAPAFVGPTLDGQTLDLAGLRGHVVVVHLWATWCLPCRAEMPVLDAYQRTHGADGVIVVGLSADRPHDLAEVRRLMQAYAFPAALLGAARTNGFGAPRMLPQTFVIDSNGVVRTVFDGQDGLLTASALGAAIQTLRPAAREAPAR